MSWQQWIVFLLHGAGFILIAYLISIVLPKRGPWPEWYREWRRSLPAQIGGAFLTLGGMMVISMNRRGELPQFDPNTKHLLEGAALVIIGCWIMSQSYLSTRFEALEREVAALRASSADHSDLD
jgi:hypothetical protein